MAGGGLLALGSQTSGDWEPQVPGEENYRTAEAGELSWCQCRVQQHFREAVETLSWRELQLSGSGGLAFWVVGTLRW